MQLRPGASRLSGDPERSTGMSAASSEPSRLRLSPLAEHSSAGIAPRKLSSPAGT